MKQDAGSMRREIIPPFEKGGRGGIFSCFVFFASLLFLSSCGDVALQFDSSVPTQSSPYVHRIAPANGKAGDAVTIFGFGFSIVKEDNIVTFGSISTVATGYSLVEPAVAGEIESLTVVVPAGVSAGDVNINVMVFDNVSNTDILFNITG